jgi:hypothetical protein
MKRWQSRSPRDSRSTTATGNGRRCRNSEEIEAQTARSGIARKALEKLLEKNPRSAMLLGRLGASYRTDDPARSLEFYRKRARFNRTLLNTRSVTGGAGPGASLSEAHTSCDRSSKHSRQLRAHANLATALYESKRYRKRFRVRMDLTAKPEIAWPIILLPPRTIILENTRKHSHRMKSF